MFVDTVFTVYYSFYFVFSFFFQLFILFLIIWHSPTSLVNMKKLMIATSLSQVLMCSSAFLTQVRIIAIDSSIALLSFGPCTLFGPYGCLTTYNLLNTSGCLVVTSLLHMMYYRRKLLSSRGFDSRKFFINCLIIYCPSAVVFIFSFLGPLNFNFIKVLLLSYYPNIDLQNYTLSGFSDVKHPFCSTATAIIALHGYFPPILAVFWRRRIVRDISNRQAVLSSRTQLQTRSFVQCLTWQTCLPLFFYVLPYSFYLVQQLFGIGSEITEYLVFPLNTFPAALDPIFVLIFIKPYQRKAKSILSNLLGLQNAQNSVSVATVNSQTSQM